MKTGIELNYFGTSLSSHGHYFWILHDDRMECKWLDGFKTLPFSPETVANDSTIKSLYGGTGLKKGQVKFFKVETYYICYIEGSCVDSRPGTKSVFWVNKEITFPDLEDLICNHPIARHILDKMPFPVLWP